MAKGVIDGLCLWARCSPPIAPRPPRTRRRSGAPQAQAQPQSGANECTALFAQWDAAVASGARGSRATAQAAHDLAMAAGCNPNKWLPSSMTKVYDPGTHRQGQSCSMSEIAHDDDAGLVCTQDVEGSPHWN